LIVPRLRLIEGGQSRPQGDAATAPPTVFVEDAGDENTVVGVPDFALQELNAETGAPEKPAAQLFEEQAVEAALGALADSDSVHVDLPGEIAPHRSQPVAPPQVHAPPPRPSYPGLPASGAYPGFEPPRYQPVVTPAPGPHEPPQRPSSYPQPDAPLGHTPSPHPQPPVTLSGHTPSPFASPHGRSPVASPGHTEFVLPPTQPAVAPFATPHAQPAAPTYAQPTVASSGHVPSPLQASPAPEAYPATAFPPPAPSLFAPPPGPTPQLFPPAPSRSRSKAPLVIAGLVAMLGGGLALGWLLFARDRDDTPAPIAPPVASPQAPTPALPPMASPQASTPARPPVASPQAPTPAPPPVASPQAPTPAPPPSTKPEITSLEHPALTDVVSPIRGRIAAIAIPPSHTVKVGDKLFTLRFKQSGGAKAAALVKRIAELEGMAKDDPATYEPFLTRARRDLARTQQVDTEVVKATTAGWIESRVKVGDEVKAGGVLGSMRDTQRWTAITTMRDGEPTAAWSCAIAAADRAHSAACKIVTTETIKEAPGGTRVTVEIGAATAPWLEDLDQHTQLVLEPPR
jgi:biotin carboxyl carrier protein